DISRARHWNFVSHGRRHAQSEGGRMSTEQERAEFEAWHKREMWDGGYESGHDEFYPDAYRLNERRVYENMHTQIAWRGYQAGRAALQSQPTNRWYAIDNAGLATLCADKQDAIKTASD